MPIIEKTAVSHEETMQYFDKRIAASLTDAENLRKYKQEFEQRAEDLERRIQQELADRQAVEAAMALSVVSNNVPLQADTEMEVEQTHSCLSPSYANVTSSFCQFKCYQTGSI